MTVDGAAIATDYGGFGAGTLGGANTRPSCHGRVPRRSAGPLKLLVDAAELLASETWNVE